MRIVQTTTLHWGGLPNMDYAFGAHTLLAGETGSGKTSLIDAIVAVMAGGDSRKSKFNSAQSQSTPSSRKTKRTIASYITGSNGMGGFLRPNGAHGYVCVAWNKDEGDGPYGTPFTAILGGEATLERDIEKAATLNGDLVRILVRGHLVGQGDLVTADGKVLAGNELLIALRTRYGSTAVRDFKTGGEYLAMLYAFLKGDTTPVSREEADSAIKAFVSAIAYRQPDDIDGLIREEILDSVDNDALIQRLMETIREVNRLKTESARMETNIARLEAAEQDLRAAFEAFMHERMARALIDVRRLRDAQAQADEKTSERDAHAAELDKIEGQITEKNASADALRERHRELQTRIGKDDAYAKKKELEALIADQDRGMAAIVARIDSAEAAFRTASQNLAFMNAVVDAVPALSECRPALNVLRDQFARVSIPALRAATDAVRDGLGSEPLQTMRENCAALQAVLTEGWDLAVNSETGLRSAFNRAFRHEDAAYEAAGKEAESILRRVEKLKVGEIEYPDPVEHFLPFLRSQLPDCKPRVLCDVVEVTKPEWQSAIEGYLGRDRFTILYDRAYETDVVRLAKTFRRDNPGKRGDISVPQLSLAIEDRPRIDEASIVHVIAVKNDTEADGYLKARYGRTVMVADTNALKNARSGIMQDGWSTQGYRYQQRRLPEEELVFGAEIRRKQREALLRRGVALEKETEQIRNRKVMLGKASAIAGPPDLLLTADDSRAFDEAAALRRMALDDIASLDLSTVETLIEQAEEIDGEISKLIKSVQGLSTEKGRVQGVRDSLNSTIDHLRSQIAELEPRAQSAIGQQRTLLDRAFLERENWIARFEKELKEPWTIDTYSNRSRDQATTATNATNDVWRKLEAYKGGALDFQQMQVQAFAYDHRLPAETAMFWMEDTWRQIREQIRSQRDTGLPERRQECEIAERSFTSSFTTDFCSTVLSNVEGRDDTILALNNNLERISFGGDSFHLISDLRPEYADYLDLFRKIRTLAEAHRGDLDLFNSTEFKPSERDTLLRVRDLLLEDRDGERALTELRRIADYRNYRSYDFEARRGQDTVVLSRWGTGSGGEAETPVYIIRVAVMASAFKLFSQQKKAHFRSIFMDEVFSTMDEARTRRVIGFLKELGLQIVCAAPTRSMAAVLDEFDTRINFSRYKTASGAYSDVNVINLDQARVRALYEAHRAAVTATAAAAYEKSDPPLRTVDDAARSAQSGGS
jgi:energy-coupling factor transporter ATP-binding protein EcfA2